MAPWHFDQIYSDLGLDDLTDHPGLSHTPCGVKVGVDRLDTWQIPPIQALSLVRCGGSELPPIGLPWKTGNLVRFGKRRVRKHFHPVPRADACGKARIWRRVERRMLQMTRRLFRMVLRSIGDFTSSY